MSGESTTAFISSLHAGEEGNENKGVILTKEQLVCCLITRPIIAELKCTSHTYLIVAAPRRSDSMMQISCKEFTERAEVSCLIALESCNSPPKTR